MFEYVSKLTTLITYTEAMSSRHVKSLAEFHTALTGRRTRLETVYGFALENSKRERRYCIGLECRDGRADRYLNVLRPPSKGGGEQRDKEGWKKAPARAKFFWANNFFYTGEQVVVLKDVPVSVETAASLEVVSSGTSRENVCGGILALDQTKAHVKDAISMLLWHDAGHCVCCGGTHFSGACPIGAPPEMHKLSEQLKAATRTGATTQATSSSEHTLQPSLKRVADGVEALVSEKRARVAAQTEQERARVAAGHLAQADELDSAPLADSEEVWKTPRGPHFNEARLRARLRQFQVDERFRADAETSLGGECVDLFAFAKSEVFGGHGRRHEVMQGAQFACKDPGLILSLLGYLFIAGQRVPS